MQTYNKVLVVMLHVSLDDDKMEHLTSVLVARRCKEKGYYKSEEGVTPLAPKVSTVSCSDQMRSACVNM